VPGGLPHFLEHLGPGLELRWTQLGAPHFDEPTVATLTEQAPRAFGGTSYQDLQRQRDHDQLAIPACARAAGVVGPAPSALYVSDLDGTLLLPDGTLGERTVAVVNELISAGGLFSYATARGYESAKRVTGRRSARCWRPPKGPARRSPSAGGHGAEQVCEARPTVTACSRISGIAVLSHSCPTRGPPRV